MKEKWRIINMREDNAAMNMAIDEAILMCRAKGKVKNTLRFYTWNPSAISIGIFQNLEKEVEIEKVKKEGYDIVRRYTGGGSVFHDKELTYSIILSNDDITGDILKSYEKICNGIIRGLKKIGIQAEFKAINDIIVNGKKISGNAQTRKEGVVLQHGTVLTEVDIEKMFSLLKVPDEKLKDKMIKVASDRVTSINDELGHNVDLSVLASNLKQGLEDEFSVEFVYDKLSFEEEELARKLYDEKYSTKEWREYRK